MAKRYDFSVTPKGRVSPVRRKGLTLLPRIVRRPQHLPPGCQLRSPERSTHFLLSILRYAGLFRTRQASIPDSTAQLSVLSDRPTILLTIHHRPLVRLLTRNLHTPTQRNHTINSIYLNNSRIYINPRNTLVNLNTISKRLYFILKTRLLSSRIHTQIRDSTCHRKRPPPVNAAVSYDDSVRSLGDPGPLFAT